MKDATTKERVAAAREQVIAPSGAQDKYTKAYEMAMLAKAPARAGEVIADAEKPCLILSLAPTEI
jgi:hypothetical protein